MDMRVGHIPSLTWNRLDINSALLKDVPALNTEVDTRFESLPEGVSVRSMKREEADKWLLANAPAEPAEHVMAGKVPIYHPQKFATGLGAEYDSFLRNAKGDVEFIEAAPGAKPAASLLWNIDFTRGSRAAAQQLIHVGEGASLTVIMSAKSPEGASGLAGLGTRIVLEKNAELFLVRAQMLGSGFIHLDDVGAALKAGASMKMVQLELGGGRVFAGVQGELVGDKSRWESRTGYIGRGTSLVDLNYNVVQRGKKTNCEMHFDGVLDDSAEKRLSDTIDFRRGSKGSYGHEKEDVLLLGDDIVNKSLPVILCEEEDMEGSHGATIGRLDDDMLFYMASRGIDEKAAEQIMVRARLSAVARDIPDKQLKKEIHDYIEEAFKA